MCIDDLEVTAIGLLIRELCKVGPSRLLEDARAVRKPVGMGVDVDQQIFRERDGGLHLHTIDAGTGLRSGGTEAAIGAGIWDYCKYSNTEKRQYTNL